MVKDDEDDDDDVVCVNNGDDALLFGNMVHFVYRCRFEIPSSIDSAISDKKKFHMTQILLGDICKHTLGHPKIPLTALN